MKIKDLKTIHENLRNKFACLVYNKNPFIFNTFMIFQKKSILTKVNFNKYQLFQNYSKSPFCRFQDNNKNFNVQKDKVQIDTENLTRKFNSLFRFQEQNSQFKKQKVEEDENTDKDKDNSENKQVKKNSIIKKTIKGLVKLWRDTFPKEIDYADYMSKKMEEAKLLKDKLIYAKSEEDIANYQSTVLEWKRTAVVLVMEEIQTSKESLLSYYSKLVSEKIQNTKTYENVTKTSSYKEYEQFKEDLQVIKHNIKENIAMSYNPAVIVAKDLIVSLFIVLIVPILY